MTGYPRTNRLFDTTFCGIEMRQIWGDVPIWEIFLNRHPVKSLVELGTGEGGFSLFLQAQAIARGAGFFTFDRNWPAALVNPLGRVLNLGANFYWGDYFEEGKEMLLYVLRNAERPLMLFVDGGSKKREFARFVPELLPGDFVAVHDYTTEFQPEDVDVVAHLITPVLEDETSAGPKPVLTRFWEVTPCSGS